MNQHPLGLYLHVPFCAGKCPYCDFYSLSPSPGQMDRYQKRMEELLALWGRRLGRRAATVYFGGGTPSLLGAGRLSRLLEAAGEAFGILPGAEITCEVNPGSVNREFFRDLRAGGFNRISLGMQSADGGELKALGRVHTPAQVRSAVDAARRAGFDNLSLDLIYGLPGQSLARWLKNLAAAAELSPEHLSCYGLKAEPGTPLYAHRDTLPGDEAQAEMYLEAVAFLEARGYRQYEISNFAKPGRESRHNLKYWALGEYAGFGPGAHSDFRGRRFAWARDLESFLRGERRCSESQAMTPDDRREEWLMLSLRLARGLDPAEWERRFHRSFGPFLPFLERCRQAGYAAFDSARWRLTPRGFLVSNQIIREFLSIASRIPSG